MDQQTSIYWIWLAEALHRSGIAYRKLIGRFTSPEELYFADEKQLRAIPGLSEQTIAALMRRDLTEAGRILDACERMGIHLLHYGMKEYPQPLRDIASPPPLLYYVGTLPDFSTRFSVGMVGTRRMTTAGMKDGYRLAYELASAGAIIVSGLAEGIDGVCSAAALEAKGTTVAIIGCGLDIAYPKHHAHLMRCIARNGGAILSEYPPGTKPSGHHFPVRNRLISGLSQAVIVVEAGAESGSLITARDAVVQGKELFTVPSTTGNPETEGNNLLIRDGAMVILQAQDLIDHFRYLFDRRPLAAKVRRLEGEVDPEVLVRYGVIGQNTFPGRPAEERKPVERQMRGQPREPSRTAVPSPERREPAAVPGNRNVPKSAVPDEVLQSLTTVQRAVLEAMPDDCPVALDALKTDYSFGEVLAALTVLEISGIVRKLPGSMYTKA